jgi:hypothetical protein
LFEQSQTGKWPVDRVSYFIGLTDLLTSFASSECSDPRDKAYSLLGLLGPENDEFLVDYSLGRIDVLLEVLRATLLANGSLESHSPEDPIARTFWAEPTELASLLWKQLIHDVDKPGDADEQSPPDGNPFTRKWALLPLLQSCTPYSWLPSPTRAAWKWNVTGTVLGQVALWQSGLLPSYDYVRALREGTSVLPKPIARYRLKVGSNGLLEETSGRLSVERLESLRASTTPYGKMCFICDRHGSGLEPKEFDGYLTRVIGLASGPVEANDEIWSIPGVASCLVMRKVDQEYVAIARAALAWVEWGSYESIPAAQSTRHWYKVWSVVYDDSSKSMLVRSRPPVRRLRVTTALLLDLVQWIELPNEYGFKAFRREGDDW